MTNCSYALNHSEHAACHFKACHPRCVTNEREENVVKQHN